MRYYGIKRGYRFVRQISWNNLCLLLLLFLPLITPAQEVSVAFSSPGGFYESPFSLSLSCPNGYSIHYTVNGNTPSMSDPIYEEPMMVDEKLFSKSNIYTIPTCPDSIWFVPDTIQRCIVIRAAAFNEEGNLFGDVVTHSFFIQSLWPNISQLPVISLCCDSLSLFDYDTGIMVQGAMEGNYFQKGRDWERLCNVEFYEPDNTGINQQAGIRIHGAAARCGIQKGLRLYARKEYGEKRLKHPFFKDTEIKSFKHLVLKPFEYGLFKDYLCSKIASPLDFETPQSRPAILFLNGEYWGLYYLKERPDDQFLEDHYGYDKEDINVIESWEGSIANGSNESYIQMMQWFMKANLSDPTEYEQACRLIDVNCFIDYYCFQLFTANADWPNNNMRCWQANEGPWRWIFHDGDYCLTDYQKMLSKTLYNKENKDISTLLFSKLLMNEAFRDQFYERMGYLLTNEFDSRNTKPYFTACMKSIEKEIDSQFERFGLISQKALFDFRVHFVDEFLSIRMVSTAAIIYKLYYYNGWTYNNSKVASQSTFKYKENSPRPVFLFRMARQFHDWRYISRYFAYERYRIRYEIETSQLHQYLKTTKIWKWLKGLK